MQLASVRIRMLAAMGLGAAGCAAPAPAPVVVQPVQNPAASAQAQDPAPAGSHPVTVVVVTDPAPSATVSTSGPVAPVASSAPKADAGAQAPTGPTPWTVTYPLTQRTATQWCSDKGTARCFVATQAQASPGTAVSKNVPGCPVALPVVCPCRGRNCAPSDDQACTQPLLEKLTALQRRQGRAEACCYEVELYCGYPGEGRPLQGALGPVLASAVLRDDFSAADVFHDPSRDWTHVAALEHASIASFAMLSLELMALGAPADLLRRVHLAALDEISHAEYAFAMASPAGARLGPSALGIPSRPSPSLQSVAVESLRDGCFGETVAALSLQRRAQQCPDEDRSKILARMAEDELRHAELAFAIVAWAVRQGGAPVLDAIRVEAERLGAHPVASEVVAPCVQALAAA